jgi:hypothetical protein
MTNPYATAITITTIAVANTITTLQPTATPQNSPNHVAARARRNASASSSKTSPHSTSTPYSSRARLATSPVLRVYAPSQTQFHIWLPDSEITGTQPQNRSRLSIGRRALREILRCCRAVVR